VSRLRYRSLTDGLAVTEPKKTQAISLLEGILEDTHSAAESERAKLEAQLRERGDVERARKQEAEKERQADIHRRLDADVRRQEEARERRDAAMEALRIEELKEKGLWTEPVKVSVPTPASVPVAPRMTGANTAEVVAAQQRSSAKGRFLVLAAILVAGIAGALFFKYGQPVLVDSLTEYAAASPSIVERPVAIAAIGFVPIPDPIVVAAAPEEEATSSSSRRDRRNRDSSSSSRGSTPPRIQLGGELRDGNR
jgi:hypothetical protein